jgi:hypothetical protein
MDQAELSNDLLRGAAAIAMEIFGKDDLSAQRRVHHLRDQLPVFQIDDKKGASLFAFRSRLRACLENKSAEKEARMAAIAAIKPATPKPRRRRQSAAAARRSA